VLYETRAGKSGVIAGIDNINEPAIWAHHLRGSGSGFQDMKDALYVLYLEFEDFVLRTQE